MVLDIKTLQKKYRKNQGSESSYPKGIKKTSVFLWCQRSNRSGELQVLFMPVIVLCPCSQKFLPWGVFLKPITSAVKGLQEPRLLNFSDAMMLNASPTRISARWSNKVDEQTLSF